METTKKRTLFEITKELEVLNEIIESIDDLDEETKQQLSTEIDNLFQDKEISESDFNNKIDSYLALLQSCKYWSQIRKQELDRIKKLVDTDEKTVEFLTQRLKDVFESRNIKKVKTTKFNLTIAKNGGKPPIEIDEDIDLNTLPDAFKSITIEIDKKAIRQALECGEVLDFANFSERGTHLRIK